MTSEGMTSEGSHLLPPEREAEIREWTAQKQHCEFYGSHWLMASDLLAEIDRLRETIERCRKDADQMVAYNLQVVEQYSNLRNEMEIWVGRTNDLQENFDVYYEKYEDLKTAAAPFITHSARLASQSTDGKAYVLIEVPVDDILNLRKELLGT